MELLLENLELVSVDYDKTGQKATLTFFDEKNGDIYDVNFNKRVYKDGNYVDDEEKAEKVDGWCKEYFDTDFDKLASCIGVKKDIYAYDTFSSLWEVEQIAKFTKEDEGIMINSNIKDIVVDDLAIHIKFEYEGKTYQSNMSYSKYIEKMNKYFKDPIKKNRQFEKFEEKFGVPVEEAETLIGKPIIVEVKSAFGKSWYAEIKKPPKKW